MCRIANRIWCVIFSVVFLMSVMASVQAAVQVTVADKAPQSIATTDTDNNWLAKVKKDLAEKEYLPSINHKGLQSPNRAHNLRIYYTEQGIQVHDRTTKDEPLLLNMRLSHYGREKQLKTINPTQPVQKDRQIEYRYNSSITEWYDNGAKGLEHGFLLHNKLRGKGEVQLVIRLDGATTSGGDAGSIRLTTATGRQLQYDALKVFDARGKPVPARMSGQGKQIKLTINDDEAEWPLLVDPLLTSSTDTLLESNQASAEFGISVASAGDVNGDGYSDVVVGARLYDNGATNEGAAFVYHGSTGGLPTTASVQLESNLTNAYFGFSVASAGDVNGDGYNDVMVGAYAYGGGGAAFVYHGGAGGLATMVSTQLESNQNGAYFGFSVASAGDVNGDGYSDVIVGANFYGGGGAAFVYHGGAGGLATMVSTQLQLESNQVNAYLGASVASAGDVNGDGYSDVVVGAYGYDNVETDEGVAFVYHGGAGGLATTASAQLASNQAGAYFGRSVASAGDVNGDGYSDVVVGAYGYDNVETDEGVAFVYHGGAGGLATTASAQLESNQAGARFGIGVASAGDVNGDGYSDVIVGSFGYANGEDNEGAAFIYHGGAGGLAITASVQLESNQVGASFGTSVASAGDVNGDGYSDVVVGAYFYGEGGAAFVYHGGAGGLVMTASTQLESNRVDASFGASVASAGDVNGDGYSDVVVGASGYDNGESNEGAAFVYHGGASGLATIASVQLESNQIDAYFGRSVASAGDVNGDGYSDVIVGAFRYDNDETDEGAAFVYYGGAGGVAMTASVQLESNQAGAVLGFSVASAGDVNGDGYSDVIVGANAYSNGQAAEGAAFIYHGSASGLATTMSAQLESNQAYANFGWSVASAGDVNGDSYSDVVVGAGGEAYEKAFVYHGGAGGLATTASTKLESNQPYAEFGVSVASAGDVNGDGYSDVVVGARYYGNGEGSEGAAFVYHGSAGGLAMTVSTQLASNQAGALFGSSVASAGDVNGDGYSDVIVGALGYSHGGAAFVYHGSAGGLAMIASVQLESNQVYASFGNSVASAGDVNGDGYSDVIVGADRYDNGEDNEGAAFIYHGNSDGRLVQARQYRQNTTIAPVALLGGSYAAGQFTVSLHATHPLGRGAVKLQVESCPNAVPFGDASCILDTQEAWRLVYGDAGSSLSQTISKQVEGLYQWRARILIAREGVLKAGIVSPANPAHSPWRRLAAHANNADIRLTNFLNDAPVIETGTGGYSLAEGVAVGTAVATIVASDVDGTLPVYSITLGNSAGHFAIDSGTGVITVATGLDYESIKHYSLTVSANDGALSDEGVVTIAITNVIDTPEDQLGSGGGGGCTLNQHAVFDPTLPVMLSLGLFYLLRRRRG